MFFVKKKLHSKFCIGETCQWNRSTIFPLKGRLITCLIAALTVHEGKFGISIHSSIKFPKTCLQQKPSKIKIKDLM